MKFGAGLMVRVIVVVCFKFPEVPVIVTVAVPAVAVRSAENLIVLLVVAGFVPNAAVTPLGSPDGAKVTSPSKPFSGLTEIVLESCAPCTIDNLFGLAESV